MSFTPLMMKLVASLLDDLPKNPEVVELGNQTFNPTRNGTLTRKEDLMFPLVIDFLRRRGKPFDSTKLGELAAMDPAQQRPHTAAYYKALGFRSYDAIDVNSMYGSIIMDLNVDIHESYGFDRTFDLVTNNGTGEHIFNQAAVFRNMHQLARTGGILLFALPFYNWMNHGFFNFNPVLFADLAAANRYDVVRMSVGCVVGQEVAAEGARVPDREIRLQWQPQTSPLTLSDFQNRGAIKPRTPRNLVGHFLRVATGRPSKGEASKLPGVVESLAERVPNIMVVAALRKTSDDPFVMPLQGMYGGQNVEDTELRQQYAKSGTVVA